MPKPPATIPQPPLRFDALASAPAIAFAVLLWAFSSLLSASLWMAASSQPGTALAEFSAPLAHAVLPRGRAWPSSAAGGSPYWLPRQHPQAAHFHPGELITSIGATSLLLGAAHAACFSLVWILYRRLGHPPYWRPAGPAVSLGLATWSSFMLALAFAALLAAVWPALARFAWLLWWKFDVYDTFGGFETLGRSATRNGAAVALGRFGVSGMWLGAALGYLLLLSTCARAALRRRLRALRQPERLCASCGFSMWRGVSQPAPATTRCPECGLVAASLARPAVAPPFGLPAPPRLGRFLFAFAWFIAIILLAWPLTYAWLGRVLPDSWVVNMPF